MIVKQTLDSKGNVVYEEHDDGYREYNTYDDSGHLIRSEQHYRNGLVEVEQWKGEGKSA